MAAMTRTKGRRLWPVPMRVCSRKSTALEKVAGEVRRRPTRGGSKVSYS